MTLSFQRCVVAGILVIWGMLLAGFYATGQLNAYLHPSFHIWTLVSGIVLVLMAAGTLFLPGGKHVLCDEGSTVQQTRRSHIGLIISAIVLIVPLLTAVIFSPGQYGANAIQNRGYVQKMSDLPAYQPYVEPALPTEDGSTAPATASATTPDPASQVPRNADGQIIAEPTDLLYGAEEPTIRADFENQEVVMIGQYMPAHGYNPKGDRFSLVKMVIVCCAADARPVAVSVEAPAGTKIPEMSWVKVTGKATFPVEGGRMTPVVVGDHVQTCDPPADTFIYN